MKLLKTPPALRPACLAGVSALLVAAASYTLDAQVTQDRLLRAASEPQNWLTYNGTYSSQRYSTLDRITPANVTRLESKWVVQNQVFGAWQSNPLVVDGVMYLTQRPNDVMAVDAKTGSLYWLYRHTPSEARAGAWITAWWPEACRSARCAGGLNVRDLLAWRRAGFRRTTHPYTLADRVASSMYSYQYQNP